QGIADIPLHTAAELQIIFAWNETATEYPRESCLQYLFEAQVNRSPGAVAVEFAGRQLSYRELNERANQLAHLLIESGAGKAVPVAICLDHSTETLVALLATLKAGAPYLPIDPQYPRQRISFMLQDAQVQV